MNIFSKKSFKISIFYFLSSLTLFTNSYANTNFDFESGQKVKLGTLYVNDTKVINPTNPTTGGDIPSYKTLGVGSEISIKNTDNDEAYQIRWVPVKVNGRKLLISDRNLLSYISWDNLNEQDLIEGKRISIDGEEYILRVLKGGSDYKGDAYLGAKESNEWDSVIANEDGYDFLPVPTETDLDDTLEDSDQNGVHNQYWNWYKFNSWTQSKYVNDETSAIYRGYYSARTVSHNTTSEAFSNYGWRPVLEIPASAEEIAEEAVLKAEQTKSDTDIENAIDLINILSKSSVKSSLNSRIAIIYIERAEESRSIIDIEKARLFLNTLDEDENKVLLNDRLNNVFPNLEINHLTASNNLDIYIKSENLLSISLDTNSITFNDFSGVEDLEKLNAINLTVSSSLPYQLNAYLSTEIQNSDQSSTMDKNIFNIKDNSETNYQTFINTIDKIVLKDNCFSGNNLIHGIDIKLKSGISFKKDIYKTTVKFEVQQK